MYTYSHPRPSVAVDIVLFKKTEEDIEVLLIKRGQNPYKGSYALPGGFVNLEESLQEAAIRELLEETGVKEIPLIQVYTFSDPDRDPRGRVISTAFTGLTKDDYGQLSAGSDADDLDWFPVSDLPPLAFDHKMMITKSIEKLNLSEP